MSLCFCIQIMNVITAGGFVIDYILKVFLLCLHPPYSPAVTDFTFIFFCIWSLTDTILTCFQRRRQEDLLSVINIQLVAASPVAFIVREGARTLMRFEAFDFLLSGFKMRRHAAALTPSVRT